MSNQQIDERHRVETGKSIRKTNTEREIQQKKEHILTYTRIPSLVLMANEMPYKRVHSSCRSDQECYSQILVVVVVVALSLQIMHETKRKTGVRVLLWSYMIHVTCGYWPENMWVPYPDRLKGRCSSIIKRKISGANHFCACLLDIHILITHWVTYSCRFGCKQC